MERYLKALERFWEKHKRVAFSHVETALGLFLLNEWQVRGFPAWFAVETRFLEVAVPIARKTLVLSRETLRNRGILEFEARGGRSATVYHICKADKTEDFCVSLSNTNGNTNQTCVSLGNTNSYTNDNTNPFVLPRETLLGTQTTTQKKKPSPPYPPIKKNIYSTPTSLNSDNNDNDIFPPGMEIFSIGEIVVKLKDSTEWKESMMRTFGIGEAELLERLDRYPDHCTTLGETRKTMNEAKRHFTNWLRKLQQSRQLSPITNETKREDRFSERRGTDPAANRAEDYTSTF